MKPRGSSPGVPRSFRSARSRIFRATILGYHPELGTSIGKTPASWIVWEGEWRLP
jgi:hypothetical protein